MQKIAFTLLIIGILGGITIVATLLLTDNTSPNAEHLAISGSDGKKVTVNNFKKNVMESTPGATTIKQEPSGAAIFYNEPDNTFSIVLNEYDLDNFNVKRYVAEFEFLSIMGITKEEACRLRVEVSNVGSPEEELQNQIFPLSFCQ
jgi:hypothetical protein